MVRSQKRNSCTRTATGRKRSIKAIRSQARRMGLKTSGSKAEICNRITSKIRRSRSPSYRRMSRSPSYRRRSVSRNLLMKNVGRTIDCKKYKDPQDCYIDPNCNWLGGKLNRCQARYGVRQGRLYQGPMQQLLSQKSMFKGVSPDVISRIEQQKKNQIQDELRMLKQAGNVTKSPFRRAVSPSVTPDVPPPAPSVVVSENGQALAVVEEVVSESGTPLSSISDSVVVSEKTDSKIQMKDGKPILVISDEDIQKQKSMLKKTPERKPFEKKLSPLQMELQNKVKLVE